MDQTHTSYVYVNNVNVYARPDRPGYLDGKISVWLSLGSPKAQR